MIIDRSSIINNIDYNESESELFVSFINTNETFKYSDVPKKVYDDFIKAESIGKFFSKNIKNEFYSESE